jgi:putative SOS response-associated peptidase YedK
MCGRFAVGEIDRVAWADWLGVDQDSPWPAPSWNVAPTQTAAIVVAGGGRRRLLAARWGLVPRWWRKPLAELRAATFNARAEEAAAKPMFGDAWARARCLVPCIGYYEWSGLPAARRAWFITLRTNAPGFCLAGLWARATVEGLPLPSFTVLTCPAGPATRELHPRSPVVVAEADWERWLAGGADGARLMRPAPDERVEIREVGLAVGNVRNDGPGLVAPLSAG